MWCGECYYNINNTINPCPFETPTRDQLAEEGLKAAAGGCRWKDSLKGTDMYLEVKFHDNDFGYPLMIAMENLYQKCQAIKNSKAEPDTKSIERIFKQLHEEDVLIPSIRRLWVLAQIEEETDKIIARYGFNCHVEIEAIKKPINDKYTNHLDPEIQFHEDNKFMNEDQNGEHVGLNLSTGIAMIF